MQFSLIIPAYNVERTIGKCLEAVFDSNFKDFEVIVVDDCSTDNTSNIVNKFPCKLIKLLKNYGPAYARRVAMRDSQYEINVFIDSDICIRNNTLEIVKQSFESEPDIAAVVGILSKTHPNKNFFSVYKNLYMNYIFTKCPPYVDFIYGSFYAIKKSCVNFDLRTKQFVEDTELGMRLYNSGYKILLDKTLEVVHLKKYNFLSFVENDFRTPYCWAKLFIQQNGWKKVIKTKRFCHARMLQIIGLIISSLNLVSIFMYPSLCLVFIPLFLAVNSDFFIFLKKERGIGFMTTAVFVTWIDQLIMVIGITAGFIFSPFKQGNRFFQDIQDS